MDSGLSRPVTDSFRWPESNLGGPKQKNNPSDLNLKNLFGTLLFVCFFKTKINPSTLVVNPGQMNAESRRSNQMVIGQ